MLSFQVSLVIVKLEIDNGLEGNMPGKKEARYVYSPQHLKTIFDKIQTTGRPDRLTGKYLKDAWVLTDNNYRAVLPLLKDMEFIKDDGTPTDRYAEYQNQNLAKKALSFGLSNAYPTLFARHPNACSMTKAELEGYFRQNTGTAGSVLDKIISTFSTLCAMANLTDGAAMTLHDSTAGMANNQTPPGVVVNPAVQLNIEIHIDANTPEQTIESIFKNMREYLLKPTK